MHFITIVDHNGGSGGIRRKSAVLARNNWAPAGLNRATVFPVGYGLSFQHFRFRYMIFRHPAGGELRVSKMVSHHTLFRRNKTKKKRPFSCRHSGTVFSDKFDEFERELGSTPTWHFFTAQFNNVRCFPGTKYVRDIQFHQQFCRMMNQGGNKLNIYKKLIWPNILRGSIYMKQWDYRVNVPGQNRIEERPRRNKNYQLEKPPVAPSLDRTADLF